MPHISMLTANQDNYCYIIDLDGTVIAIDPGEAKPVLTYVREKGGKLDLILNTHMHQDHCQGNLVLKQATGCKVIGCDARIPEIDQVLSPEENLPTLAQNIKVL